MGRIKLVRAGNFPRLLPNRKERLQIGGNYIELEHFRVPIKNLPSAFEGIKLIQISDLHLSKRRPQASVVLQMVASQAPDFILLTGDILHNYNAIAETDFNAFLTALTKISPVYAVTGNHELRNGSIAAWRKIYEALGVYPLDNRYEIIERENQALAIMGLAGNTPYFTGLYKDIERLEGMPKILLSHRPEHFKSCLSEAWSIRPNLVLSGHAHGGQVRLPFLGGLYAPGQGIFPQYTSGLYCENGTYLLVSRGLTHKPKRVNNAPHLPVVVLQNEGGACEKLNKGYPQI